MIHFDMVTIVEKLDRMAVTSFLRQFKIYATNRKIAVFERVNYLQTLARLGILHSDAIEIILGLTPQNYYKGLGPGDRDNEQICEFGARVEEEEIYIKLLMDTKNERACCFSFHIAGREITYPFADDVGSRR